MLQKGLDELRKLSCWWIYGRRLSAYLDHELNDLAARTTANHLGECERCQAQLEEVRFANRVLAEFEIPFMSTQLPSGNVFRLPQVKQVSRLKRLACHKIQVPLPLAAGLLIGLITITLLAVGNQPTADEAATPATSPFVVIKRVEVPVDRVITRTVYVNQPGSRQAQILPRKDMNQLTSPHSKENIAQNNSKAPEWTDDVLKGFRPAVDANLRVIKGHEK